MQHGEVWRALDALAMAHNLTPSGLARAAGLDPTTFNRSKRLSGDGKPRWPSTESLARALDAVGADLEQFAALAAGRGVSAGRAIPIVGMARAGGDRVFDETGFPVGADEKVRFPGLGEERVYALEISGDSMAPALRPGDIVIVQPEAPLRRGDRVVARTHSGEVLAKELGRRTDTIIELLSLNPAYPPRIERAVDIAWLARIIWSSQ